MEKINENCFSSSELEVIFIARPVCLKLQEFLHPQRWPPAASVAALLPACPRGVITSPWKASWCYLCGQQRWKNFQ